MSPGNFRVIFRQFLRRHTHLKGKKEENLIIFFDRKNKYINDFVCWLFKEFIEEAYI